MHWLQRPPYLRWAAAALLVAVALYADLRPAATVLHPFAGSDLAPGDGLKDIEWRAVPEGLLAPVDVSGRTIRPILAGEPLVASAIGATSPVPDGWWAVPVPLPPTAQIGGDVRVVMTESGQAVPGVVVAAASDDPLAYEPTGLVAVPPDAATMVAVAAAARTILVLVAP